MPRLSASPTAIVRPMLATRRHRSCWTPERLTDEQQRLFQELAKLEGEPPKRSPGFWSKLKEALGA